MSEAALLGCSEAARQRQCGQAADHRQVLHVAVPADFAGGVGQEEYGLQRPGGAAGLMAGL
jgi:hypothetical protein